MIVGIVAAFVYILDVRPALVSVTRRRWADPLGQTGPMPLDPDLAGLLALVEAGTPMVEQTPEEARASFRRLAVDFRKAESVVPVGEVTTRPSPARPVTSRRASTGPRGPVRSRRWPSSTAAAS